MHQFKSLKTISLEVSKRSRLLLGIILWSIFIPVSGNNPPILDSIAVWKKDRKLNAICEAAETMDKLKPALSTCEKMKVLLAASRASFDLYQPEQCLRYAKTARKLPTSKCPDSTLIMELILQEAIGLNMYEHADKDKLISLTEEVIRYGEQHQNEDMLITAYSHMGMILNKLSFFQKARDWFQKAHEITKYKPKIRRIATSYANLALCDLNLNQAQRGLIMIDSAIYFIKKIDSPPLLAHCYGLKSELHFHLGDEANWADALDKAIQISKSTGNLNQMAMGLADKLDRYVEKGRYEQAISTGAEVLEILEGNNQYPIITRNVYEDMFMTYLAMGNTTRAGQYFKKYVTLKDSLEDAAFQKEVFELNLKYEVQEKDKKLLQHQLDLKNSRMMLWGALAGITVLSVIAFFIYWRNSYQKQVISTLFHKERELEFEIQRLHRLFPSKNEDSPVSIESSEEKDLLQHLFLKSCQLMETEKLYLEPELDLNELVKRLNTNRKYLSLAINQYSVDGFRSFLNRYRVEHAKSIIWEIASEKSDLNIGEVWNHSGMNSIQNFYRVFKSVTGLTPKEYHDQVKLELKNPPVDNESETTS